MRKESLKDGAVAQGNTSVDSIVDSHISLMSLPLSGYEPTLTPSYHLLL